MHAIVKSKVMSPTHLAHARCRVRDEILNSLTQQRDDQWTLNKVYLDTQMVKKVMQKASACVSSNK